MMEQARLFSADSHVNEPPDAWERIPKGSARGGLALCRTRRGSRAFTWSLKDTSRTR